MHRLSRPLLLLSLAACNVNVGKLDDTASHPGLMVEIQLPYVDQTFVREDGIITCIGDYHTDADPTALLVRWSVDGAVLQEEAGDAMGGTILLIDPVDMVGGAHALKLEVEEGGALKSAQHNFFLAIDEDGDGYTTDRDCDDADADVSPAGLEVCDGVDNDCSGYADNGASDSLTFYLDQDGDGYGKAVATTQACEAPAGYVQNSEDCDDNNQGINPGMVEVCGDSADNNCDGVDGYLWYYDGDNDGFGTTLEQGVESDTCGPPAGAETYVDNNDDCNDSDPTINPSAPEVCDGADVDEDCDTWPDNQDSSVQGTITQYRDRDGDGYGDGVLAIDNCDLVSGYAVPVGDCDDGEVQINPGAAEMCGDGVDNDCTGAEDDNPVDGSVYYQDADGDGYGNPQEPVVSCSTPAGYVSDSQDCDDGNAVLNPQTLWYADQDSDSYGDPQRAATSCVAPAGYVADATDCNDSTALAYPGYAESCDGLDNDCNVSTDDGVAEDPDETAGGQADNDSPANAVAITMSSGYGSVPVTTGGQVWFTDVDGVDWYKFQGTFGSARKYGWKLLVPWGMRWNCSMKLVR